MIFGIALYLGVGLKPFLIALLLSYPNKSQILQFTVELSKWVKLVELGQLTS